MAMSDAVEIVYVVEDEESRQRSFGVHVPWLTNATDHSYEALGDEFADEIEKMTAGELISATLHIPIQFDFTPAAALAGSDVEELGRVRFRTDDGTISTFAIPTIKEALVLPGTSDIDMLHADVVGFADLLVNGADADPGVGVNLKKIMDYRGAIITTVIGFIEDFLRYRGKN